MIEDDMEIDPETGFPLVPVVPEEDEEGLGDEDLDDEEDSEEDAEDPTLVG